MSDKIKVQPRKKMHPGPGNVEKAKDFKGTIAKLITYLGNFKWAMLVVFIFAAGSTVFNIIGPSILGDATTEIYTGLISKVKGGSGIDFGAIGDIISKLIIIYITSLVFALIQGMIMTKVTNVICYRLRDDISKKIHRMPMKYFESRSLGDVLSRVTNDVDTLNQGMNQSLSQLVSSVTQLIGVFIMMVRISGIMTAAAVCILPISLIGVGLIGKVSQKYFKMQQDYLGRVNGQVEEVYSGHLVVKAFNREEKMKNEFQEVNGVLYESAWKSQFFAGTMMPLMQFVGNLGYAVIAILGGYMVMKDRIKVGDIQSFVQYIRMFTQPIQQLAQISNMFQSTAAAAERVFEFLEEEEESPTVENPETSDGLIGNVTFKNVSFGYNEDKIIIKNFSANVKDGQKVAIVGPTGAGKTTLIKLLMRFYDVNNGEILVDGVNIKNFDRGELRNMFGMVLQDTWLFNGSIKENIRYGKLDATDEEVVAAAKAAHAHHFIKTQSAGYDMELNEETSNISQGQKQLLTIARALLADPKILILDEATSSVDTRTEVRIQKAMNNLMKGRTSFVIAHRLSTIRDADLILVMKDGDIVEQGNHEELIAQNGFYAELYNSQFA